MFVQDVRLGKMTRKRGPQGILPPLPSEMHWTHSFGKGETECWKASFEASTGDGILLKYFPWYLLENIYLGSKAALEIRMRSLFYLHAPICINGRRKEIPCKWIDTLPPLGCSRREGSLRSSQSVDPSRRTLQWQRGQGNPRHSPSSPSSISTTSGNAWPIHSSRSHPVSWPSSPHNFLLSVEKSFYLSFKSK